MANYNFFKKRKPKLITVLKRKELCSYCGKKNNKAQEEYAQWAWLTRNQTVLDGNGKVIM